jgi:hypothetical protein
MRRVAFSASRDAVARLEAEAARRGVSIDELLAEAVEEKAAAIRASRHARVGLGRSRDGRSAAQLTASPVAEPPA